MQPVAVIYLLMLIMYIGRRDFGRKVRINSFWRRYKEVRLRFETAEEAVTQMMEKVPLPGYLEEGLRLLAKNGIEVDELLR
jgi:hypothetical protein